jgi:hypothetical protein
MKRVLAVAIAIAATPVLSGCVVASTSDSRGGGGRFFVLALPFLLLFVVLSAARRMRRRPRVTNGPSPDGGANLSMLRAELSVLADDVLRLEPQVALHSAARDDYESATHRYRVAQAALDQSEAPVDLVRVQRVVDEASYAMARARAVVEGRTPPAPPPVLQSTGPRGEPAVELDDRLNPVYVGNSATFRSGWFGVGGGLFGGLLLGSMFGGVADWDWEQSQDGYLDDGGDRV